jgi:hypothetical protein
MRFNELGQIKKEFGIEAEELEEIRKQLRQLLREVHPDTNGGSFATEDAEKQYHKISDAINFIDERKSTDNALILRSEVQELIRVIRDIVPQATQSDPEKKLAELIDSDIKIFKTRHKFPKITTATISVVISALWLFPNTIKEHPVLSRLIDLQSPSFTALWLLTLAATASYWLLTALQEHREEQSKKYLKLETVQNQIFRGFLRYKNYVHKKEDKNEVLRFEKDDLIGYVKNFEQIENPIYSTKEKLRTILEQGLRLHYRAGNIDTELAQSLADTIVQRGLLKGIIEKESKKSLSDIFIVKASEDDLK